MSYRQHPTKGPGWWQIWYRPPGSRKPEVFVIECSEEDAARFDLHLKREKTQVKQIVTMPTIGDMIPDYLDYYRLDHLDSTNVTRYLFRWRTYVGNLTFGAVSEEVFERYKRDRMADGIKPTTINKEVSALAGMLKWGIRKGYLVTLPRIERFSNKKTKAPLPDVPTRAEVLALINAMIWPQCGYFACLYYGGLRAGEAEGLKAEDVYLDRRMMIVTGKGNKQRPVAIPDGLVPWMEKRLAEVHSGLLWTTRTGGRITDPKQHIKWACKRAGITRRMYPHLLRHAYGTHATMDGIGLRHIQYNLGHTSLKMTEIYTTLGCNAIIEEITGKFGKG